MARGRIEVTISSCTKLQFPEGHTQDENDVLEQPELQTANGLGKGANENLHEAEKHRPFPLQVRTPELRAVTHARSNTSNSRCHKTDGFCSFPAEGQN